MASIERTAYPRFKRNPTAKELQEVYTPTPQEISFAHQATKGEQPVLSILVLLKAFQRLGYFPRTDDIPTAIVQHIRSCLHLPQDVVPTYPPRSLYRHQKAIREYLEIIPYGRHARHIATEAAFKAARVMDNPADLINVAIEELIKQRCELPGFSTLDRMARRVRTLVNTGFFQTVLDRLSQEDCKRLDKLLDADDPVRRSDFNYLKEPPKSATVSHMHELHVRLAWLSTLGSVEELLTGIPNAKVKHFAAEARALDAAEMKEFAQPKQYTLLVSMLHRARIAARDNLVETFLKRIGRIHNNGKRALAELREQHRSKQDQVNAVFTEVLQADDGANDDAEYGRRVRAVLAARGGRANLLDAAEAVSSYSGNNYLPLLWKYYKSHRGELFRMVRLLDISSTTQDQTLIKALDFLLQHENRRGEFLPAALDLSFASELSFGSARSWCARIVTFSLPGVIWRFAFSPAWPLN